MLRLVKRWGPAIFVMAIIFLLSATPSEKLPNIGVWDTLLKKLGHMTGYFLLAMAYRRGLMGNKSNARGIALGATLVYAISDEVHQALVPGRHPSLVDIGIDFLGAALAMIVYEQSSWMRKWLMTGS